MKLRLIHLTVTAGALLTLAMHSQAATGLACIDNNTNLTFYGDIRVRYELDWDSHTTSGSLRDDRNRGRVRARAGFGYQLADDWSIGARVRTGNTDSQQSPHLTFTSDDGVTDNLNFVLDRYFVQFKHGGLAGWVGRNITPFWQQNELFWDEDVTPTGLAASYDTRLGKGNLSVVGGAFCLPEGGYELNGQMFAGQVKYSLPVKKSQLTAAAGLHYLRGEGGADNLRNRNGERDYLIGVASVQWSIPVKKLPFALGADVFYNFLDYNAADVAPFPAGSVNQKLGYVFSAQLGQLKQRHDWMVGYYYAHIETFAVNASFAQDDWFRFGNSTQTDASDFQGHEVRLGYALSKNINLVARVFLVEAITTQQDGNRARLDLNWKF